MDKREELRNRLREKAKKQIKEGHAGKEVHIINATRLLEDIISAKNLLLEGLGVWKKKSPGGNAKEAVDELENNCKNLEKESENLEEFITKEMEEEMPNISALATPKIGAKLLAEAGSKKKLAFMPASTIQLLGAEKALFQHIKKNTKPPKHGYIFNHPQIQKLGKEKRGNAARTLAGKLAIAAKEDYFSGKPDGKLKEETEKKMKSF